MRLKQLFHTLETLKMSDFATERHCKQTGSRHFVMPLRDPCFFRSIISRCRITAHQGLRFSENAMYRTLLSPCGPALYAPSLHLKKNTFFILLSTRLSLSLSIVNNTTWYFFSDRQDKFFIYNEYEYTIPPSPLSLSNDFPPCNGRQKARIQEGRP